MDHLVLHLPEEVERPLRLPRLRHGPRVIVHHWIIFFFICEQITFFFD
jgi:hypothetical protein